LEFEVESQLEGRPITQLASIIVSQVCLGYSLQNVVIEHCLLKLKLINGLSLFLYFAEITALAFPVIFTALSTVTRNYGLFLKTLSL